MRGVSALTFFATAPQGLTELLAEELRALGAESTRLQPTGVYFRGPLALGYRACLWSRIAGRVLLEIASGPAADADALYATGRAIAWEEHVAPTGTIAVDFTGTNATLVHTGFAAQRVKDAIVDRLQARFGARPRVEPRRPEVRVHAHLRRPSGQGREDSGRGHEEVVLAIDLAGEGLHRRGYREDGAEAPLKENLAAGILLRAGWPAIAAAGGPLVDPMCGSGTLLIEAAMMAEDRAPGLLRGYFGLLGWRGHEPARWAELLAEARARAAAGAGRGPRIVGFDAAPAAVRAAQANAARAGVKVEVAVRGVDALVAPETGAQAGDAPKGLVVTNPPYGERLAAGVELSHLYATLGERLRTGFGGWRAAVLAPDLGLAKALGLQASRRHALLNGPIEVLLLKIEVPVDASPRPPRPRSEGALALINRLKKNHKQLAGWAARAELEAYRVYDADIPEYAVAVDLYRDWAVVQEYAAPPEIDEGRAAVRLREALAAVPEALGVPPGQVICKRRERAKGGGQYGRRAELGQMIEVREGRARFLVNLTDYLDTGLFLDHRETRARLAELARGRRVLNLFAYTATASVAAGLGGALSTTSVDMSKIYCAWARRNLDLNGLRAPNHAVIEAECGAFMAEELRRYGLIFLDPPTFSNSKRMRGVLDVQRDHVALIRGALRLLERGGILIFSTNFRRFRLDAEALADLKIEDRTAATIPRDFARSPKIHRCFQIEPRA